MGVVDARAFTVDEGLKAARTITDTDNARERLRREGVAVSDRDLS